MKKLLVTLLLIGIGWKFLSGTAGVSYGAGVLAPESPTQQQLPSATSFYLDDYQITPLAKFALKARVLSRERYFLGRESELSPVDFALGWGRMSDETILSKIEISQGHRWYRWSAKELPIPRREIETHSANMHLIPADDEISERLSSARSGEIITLSGYLVKVAASDGWRWQSSLSRDDTGNHACELIWVDNFEIVTP